MEDIKERMAEYIFCYLWYHYGKEKINRPSDIYEAMEDGDGLQDLKDTLWDLFHNELPVNDVFDKIEDMKEKEKEEYPEIDEEMEEEEKMDDSESNDE